MLFHPQELRRSEARKCDIPRVPEQEILSDLAIEIFRFLRRATIVPEDGGPQDVPVPVQRHQTVHLPGHADTADLLRVDTGNQLRDAV